MIGLEWMISSVALIVMILFIRWLFKNKLNAGLRYFLWLIVLVRLLVPVSFTGSSVSVLNLMPKESGQKSSAEAQENITYGDVAEGDFIYSEDESDSGIDKEGVFDVIGSTEENSQESPVGVWKPIHETEPLPGEKISWEEVVLVVWAAGMVVTAAVLLGSNIHFFTKLIRSRRSFAEEGVKAAQVLRESGRLPVYVTKLVSTPCLFGLFRPAIYIRPADAENQKELNYVFRHEFIHYKHGDHVWALLRSVSLVLHWYNPLVWVAAYLSKQDSELACDETVIAKMSEAERQEYGKLLISLSAKRANYSEMLCCATTMTGGKKSMKERILRIAKKPKMMLVSAVAVAVLCATVIAITFTGAKEREAINTEETGQMQPLEEPETLENAETSEDAQTSGETETPDDPDATDMTVSTEDMLSTGETQFSDATQSEPEDVMEETRIFVNDFLLDMNGDGIRDIVRLESLDFVEDLEAVTADKESLLERLRQNVASYMELRLYDGALACDNMEIFQPGDEIAADAFVEVIGDCAHAHAGNKQYSYYEEDGKGYIICNIPYCGQGAGAYGYEVFTYNRNWKRVTKAENSLDFKIEPWQPERYMAGEFSTYFERNFPIEEMVDYTLELKEYLDKATIMADTSTGEIQEFQVTTHFDTKRIIPDAYDIWYWYVGDTFSGIALEKVQTEEELRRALEGIRLQNWLDSHYFLAEEDKLIRVQSDTPPEVGLAAGQDNNLADLEWERLSENAAGLPSYVVEVAYRYCQDVFTDWKIPEMQWACTWNLNGREVDVYSYQIHKYIGNETGGVVGVTEGPSGGWIEADYGLCMCVVYDRDSGRHFIMDSKEVSPQDLGFIIDVVKNHWELFRDIYGME